MIDDHETCINEHRIVSLEKENDIKKARLDHYKNEVHEINEKIDALEEKQHEIDLNVTKSIDELKLEIVGIHTTIKNISLIVAIIGCIITVILAVPELLIILQ